MKKSLLPSIVLTVAMTGACGGGKKDPEAIRTTNPPEPTGSADAIPTNPPGPNGEPGTGDGAGLPAEPDAPADPPAATPE